MSEEAKISPEKIKELKELAEKGDSNSQYSLGLAYAIGDGVRKNYKNAIYWTQKSAEQGNADAQYNLGIAHHNGDGVKKSLSTAIRWWLKAGEQGHMNAQNDLGIAYAHGYGIEKNIKEAIEWWLKAGEQGHAEAQYNLGITYVNGYGVTKDYTKALYWIIKSAEQEYAIAQYHLGVAYANGDGVEKNSKKAAEWWLKAAEQGDADAQLNLGIAYCDGEGVKQDYKKAFDWWLKATEQKDSSAQYNVGAAYYYGEGVKQDYKKAIEWWLKAAEQGATDAQVSLGITYCYGKGVDQDEAKAVWWWLKAAKQGNSDAQYNLGFAYYDGEGVKQNYKKAVEWWLKAAEQGDTDAQLNLGIAYAEGDGVAKDPEKAVEYLRKSVVYKSSSDIEKYEKGIRAGVISANCFVKIAIAVAKILNIQEIDLKKEKDKAVSHFTSINVLKEILPCPEDDFSNKTKQHNNTLEKNKTYKINPLRLSNIHGCNDPDEGQVLFEKLDLVIPSDVDSSYPLITCFCSGKKENLPMWNTYANNSKGVVLRFNREDLLIKKQDGVIAFAGFGRDRKEIFKDGTLDVTPMAYEVLYLNHDEKRITHEDKDIQKYLLEIKANLDKLSEYEQKIAAKLLIELAHIVKYDDYEYEREIRLIYFGFSEDIIAGALKYCPNSEKIYAECPILKPIEIIAGPKVSDKNYPIVRYRANKHGINKVSRSRIRYN